MNVKLNCIYCSERAQYDLLTIVDNGSSKLARGKQASIKLQSQSHIPAVDKAVIQVSTASIFSSYFLLQFRTFIIPNHLFSSYVDNKKFANVPNIFMWKHVFKFQVNGNGESAMFKRTVPRGPGAVDSAMIRSVI